MDKFFSALLIMVISALVLSSVSIFENNSSASTFEKGVNVLLENSEKVSRQPAIVSNRVFENIKQRD